MSTYLEEPITTVNCFSFLIYNIREIQTAYNENTNKYYVNPEFLKSSELLQEVCSSLPCYDFSLEKSELIKEIEQYEQEFKIIEIFSDVSIELLKIGDSTEFPGMQDEHIKSLNTFLSYLVHTSEDDRELCNKIAQLTEFLKAVTKKLELWREPYFSKRGMQALKSNDGIIRYLVWAVSMALKTECEVWDIWSLTELAKIVKQVARNDTNRRLLVQHGVVPLLVEIAEQGETEEQYEAVCSLSNLSLDNQSKSQMIKTKHWKIIETLEKLAKSPEEAVQKISKEALCTLHSNQTQLTECLQEITSEESNGKQSISDEESSPEEIKLLSWNIEGLSSVNIKERTSAVISFINR
ncbi:uncharacterized protein LOC134689953 [Mytilus trossulus]|uniref:uncharacterized protein LOC134689953 n=1 Tax=Mytilus trossulus TaxID=6551 RepID=UPI003006EDB5